MHAGKRSHRRAKRELRSRKTGQSRDAEGRKQRKLHFSTVNSSRTVAANRPWAQIQETKSGSGIQTHPAHTHLAAQRAGPGSLV